MVDPRRINVLREGFSAGGPVMYWMQRDQRVHDNWALLHAREIAFQRRQSLVVAFCLVPEFLEAGARQYLFMIKGLTEVARKLSELNITFILETGDPGQVIPGLVSRFGISVIVTDFNPIRKVEEWQRSVLRNTIIPFYEVDAHNIIPCRFLSGKQEYSAFTLRKKVEKYLEDFMTPFPELKRHPFQQLSAENIMPSPEILRSRIRLSEEATEVNGLQSGENSAIAAFRSFRDHRLADYETKSSLPDKEGQSGLSPYLHFGQISSQRIAMEVRKEGPDANAASRATFLEQLIVRKELADNFCFYNRDYDSFKGFPAWAQRTLNAHRNDPRPYIYSLEDLENAKTHDPLWNAAQREMTRFGKMHNYMRMYWAKKILEWTPSPEEALAISIYLNDKYELDGRDPNGYAGIAWSIGGVHDRPWNERPVFGTIRYMNDKGCRRKFNVDTYISRVYTPA